MGFADELFSNPHRIPEEFKCIICKKVLQDPKELSPCHHFACSSCIGERRRSGQNSCPVDKRKIIRSSATSCKAFLSLLGRIKLQCPHCKERGVVKVVQVGEWAKHQVECPNNPANRVECGCGATLNKLDSNFEQHKCVEYLKQELKKKEDKLVGYKRQLDESANFNPGPSKRSGRSFVSPVVICTRKWGEITASVYADIVATIAAQATQLMKSGPFTTIDFHAQLKSKIIRCLDSSDVKLDFLHWTDGQDEDDVVEVFEDNQIGLNFNVGKFSKVLMKMTKILRD